MLLGGLGPPRRLGKGCISKVQAFECGSFFFRMGNPFSLVLERKSEISEHPAILVGVGPGPRGLLCSRNRFLVFWTHRPEILDGSIENEGMKPPEVIQVLQLIAWKGILGKLIPKPARNKPGSNNIYICTLSLKRRNTQPPLALLEPSWKLMLCNRVRMEVWDSPEKQTTQLL